MVTLRELRKTALERLKETSNSSPLADIDYILTGLGFEKSKIVLGDEEVSPEREEKFLKALSRLEKGEPVQYIVGGCEFMSMWFEVNRGTLIPRCDTEVLVEEVVDLCNGKESVNIFEVGSGSGCIAISLAKLLPFARVTSADISDKAIETARRNAKRLGVSDRVTFINHDIKKGFPEFEVLPSIVVSNPPYIPSRDIEGLEKKVRDFEPLTALDGGDDGLDFYRCILKDLKLASGGYLAFEVGINQADSVALMMGKQLEDVRIKKDLSGISRVVIGKNAGG